MGKKKKLEKRFSKMLDQIESGLEAASLADLNTTSSLVSRSINMQLAKGIDDARGKDGDPNLDINKDAINAAIKWLGINGFKAGEAASEETLNNVTELDEIRKKQRGRILHASGE